jgi:transcription elongation factor Elf1
MADQEQNSTEIKETDIVFDCPHCSKSLAIDYRGAGLTIPCTDCGKMVDVPIPEGMELGDIDRTDEEQEIQILNLRRSLATAEYRIEQLEEEMQELRSRRDVLEHEHNQTVSRRGRLLGSVTALRDSLQTAAAAAEAIAGDLADEEDVVADD